MTLRLKMLRTAGKGLAHDQRLETAEFILSRQCADGGFAGRRGGSDLYYTSFALDGLLACGGPVAAGAVERYISSFGVGESLDMVHLVCLARCRAGLGWSGDESVNKRIAANLERHRCPDGGYNQAFGASEGSAYGCFLALWAYQDLGVLLPATESLVKCLESLRSCDGGFANQRGMPFGSTTATAAAIVVLSILGREAKSAARWIAGCCRCGGGFSAMPGAPLPDLLSTATALHALAEAGIDLSELAGPCRRFVESLRVGGGFRGHQADDQPDCEYTFYGMLALGHLIR